MLDMVMFSFVTYILKQSYGRQVLNLLIALKLPDQTCLIRIGCSCQPAKQLPTVLNAGFTWLTYVCMAQLFQPTATALSLFT